MLCVIVIYVAIFMGCAVLQYVVSSSSIDSTTLGGGLGLFDNSIPHLSVLNLHPPSSNFHPL